MFKNPTAAILTVGTELTEGSTQDTHGRYIAAGLHALGIRTSGILLIPDSEDAFREALERLVARNDLVVITGGLGPTRDDLTRDVVASLAGVQLDFHDELWADIERRFSGRPLSATNRKQALIPRGFDIIHNPYGTAAGFWGRTGSGAERGALIVSLPGPPRELRPLFEEVVLGVVGRELGLRAPEEQRLTVFLLSESLLEQLLQENRTEGVDWGTRAEAFRIIVILRGGTVAQREGVASALERKIGWLRLRRGEVSAEQLVSESLRDRGATFCAAESCTGGLIGKLVTDISGASEHFWGSLVVYSNEAKARVLGVPEETLRRFGAVSAETVEAMTRGALELSGCDIACAVSGVAGPTGGTQEKPVGSVWIAAGGRGNDPNSRLFHFSGDRDMVRRKAAVAALLMCELTMLGKEVDNIDLWQYI